MGRWLVCWLVMVGCSADEAATGRDAGGDFGDARAEGPGHEDGNGFAEGSGLGDANNAEDGAGQVDEGGLGPCPTPPCITVHNRCPLPIWTHAMSTVVIDDGLVRKLDPGRAWRYQALPALGGGRIYAYYEEPASLQNRERLVSDKNQFVEMTIDMDPASGAWAQNYNISYVDYASLPVSMRASGASCAETRCGAPFAKWLDALQGCPTDLRNVSGSIATCMGSYNYCITPDGSATFDTTRPYCAKMMQAHGFTGSAVYGGVFPTHPATEVGFWDGVAAWNRGTVAGDADESHYYVTEPYNAYARWIHRDLGCSNVYAFSTDDHQDKAGFVRCVAPELDVVWCPDG